MNTYEAIRACSIAMLGGAILQASGVSAGRGRVIDWRTVKSGETLQEGADAFDTAQLFVALVGVDAALDVSDHVEPPPPAPKVPPRIITWGIKPAGKDGHNRSFETSSGYRILVDATDDDASHAAFVAALATLAEDIG